MDFSALDYETAPLDFLQFAQYCEALSDGTPMPYLRDFSLNDVPWLFGRFYQVDVLKGGADYRFQSFGIFWQALQGGDQTGRILSEIEAESHNLDPLREQYDQLLITRKPIAGIGRAIWPGGETITYERLMVPFTLDGCTVAQILVAAHYDDYAEDMVFYRGQGLPRLEVEDYEPRYFAKAS